MIEPASPVDGTGNAYTRSPEELKRNSVNKNPVVSFESLAINSDLQLGDVYDTSK